MSRCIDKLEQFDDDLDDIFHTFKNYREKQISKMEKIQRLNVRNGDSHHKDMHSELSGESIRKMREHGIWCGEWECLDYELPEVCKQKKIGSKSE